ncbi:MAG: ATP-binding protein [Acidimicrobiia bacterium]
MSWSSGKDSTYALAAARRDPDLDVVGLLVTMNFDADRVSMHAVRRELVVAQAERLGLPLHLVDLPSPCPKELYEEAMRRAVADARADDVEAMVFGDLYLADVRAYREQAFEGTGVTPRFPLWKLPTAQLARDMLAAGVRAVVTSVDPAQAPTEIAGRQWDERLLVELPAGVDPCGEGGEFHTFFWDGPGFREPIAVETGEIVERDGFVFCDVLPRVRH